MVHILPGRPVGKPDQMSPIHAAVPSSTPSPPHGKNSNNASPTTTTPTHHPTPNHHRSDTRHPDPRADSCLAQAAACSLIVGICTGTRRVAFRFLVASHIRQQLVEIVVDVFIAEMALVPSRRDTTHERAAVPRQRVVRQRRVV